MIIEFKKMFDRIEIYLLFTVGLLFSLFGVIDAVSSNAWCSFSDVASSYQAALIYYGNLSEIVSFVFLPVIAVLPYVDQYSSEKRLGVSICEQTRQSRASYFVKKAAVIWIVSAASIFLVYALNQIFCMIAFPTEQVRTYVNGSVYNHYLQAEVLHTPTPELYMNSQFMLNLSHILYASFYAGSLGLLGYSVSLYMKKNKAITNLLPIGISLIWTFIATYLFGATYAPTVLVISGPIYNLTTIVPSIIIICLIYLFSIAAIVLKCTRLKDEL